MKWKRNGSHQYFCSECGGKESGPRPYCPRCGAKSDGTIDGAYRAAYVQQGLRNHVDALVRHGVVTHEEADTIRERISGRIDT